MGSPFARAFAEVLLTPLRDVETTAELRAALHVMIADAQIPERTEARLLRIEPGFTLDSAEQRSPLRRPEDRALYVEGLRLGGLTNP